MDKFNYRLYAVLQDVSFIQQIAELLAGTSATTNDIQV
jgi:hypothetical protein